MAISIGPQSPRSRKPTSDNEIDESTPNHPPLHTPPPSTFPFMHLPKELRLQIYAYLAISTHTPIDRTYPKRLGYYPVTRIPPCLFLSRAVHAEATHAMDVSNTYHPATLLCRPNQQQKFCALLAALQRGHAIDSVNDGRGAAPVSTEAVDVALQTLLSRIPYGTPKNAEIYERKLRGLRVFFAHTIARLRADPVVRLTLIVRTRPYRRFYNWYGSERAARQVAWYTRDAGDVWLLGANLRAARLGGRMDGDGEVEVKVVLSGVEGDTAFERLKGYCEGGFECVALGEEGYRGVPGDLGVR